MQLTIDRGKILAADGARARVEPRPAASTASRSTRGTTRRTASSPQVVGYSTNAGTRTGLEQALQRLPDRREHQPQQHVQAGARQARRRRPCTGTTSILTLRPADPGARAQRARRPLRRGRRARREDGRRRRDGLLADLQPEPDQPAERLREDRQDQGHVRGRLGARTTTRPRASITPGSTFKLVTASAALDSGKFTPTSQFYDPGYCIEYGKRVYNSSAPDSPTAHETFGNVDFSEALEHSINSVFCNVGKRSARGMILDYAKRYGFYSRPPLDTPPDEIYPSGLYKYKNGIYQPGSRQDPATQVDPGRLAFGQERMLVDAAPDGARRGDDRGRRSRAEAVPRAEGRRAPTARPSRRRRRRRSGARSSRRRRPS